MARPNNYLKVRRSGTFRDAFVPFNDRLSEACKWALDKAMTMAKNLDEVCIWKPCESLPGINVIGESRERPKGEWP